MNPYDRFVAVLESRGFPTKGTRSASIARCPCHDDSTPSLTFKESEDDLRLLLFCQGGCETPDILKSVNWTLSDLFVPKERDRRNNISPIMRHIGTHVYRSPSSEYAYEKRKSEYTRDGKRHKSFKMCRVVDGETIWDMQGVKRYPYRIDEVIQAILRGDRIVIAEGEKDVDTLKAKGYVATTNPGGAGKWDPEFNEYFKGADVVIITDNDDVGRKHCLDVAKNLDPVVASLRIMQPVAECKDVTEHIEAGHPLSALCPFDVKALAGIFGLRPGLFPTPRVLEVVTDAGELINEAVMEQLRDQLAGAEREIRAWRQRHAELKRDRDAEAAADQLWPVAMRLFREWAEQTNHPRSDFSPDRFRLVEPYLRKHGEALVRCAIHGIALDPFTTLRANGTTERHDSWETLLKNQGAFERYVNRAPIEMLKEAQQKAQKPKRAKPESPQLRVLEDLG